METPKIIEFGRHKGDPLATVPSPYLFLILTFPNIRAHHPGFVADALDVLADRLVIDLDAVLAELLEPVPLDVIAQAKARKVEAKKTQLAKLLAERGRP